MQSFQIGANEAGQRFDKFLQKYMPEASMGFFYKMLRKKNITLNGKRAEGKELLQTGDKIAFFFSDETFHKFRGKTAGASLRTNREHTSGINRSQNSEYKRAYETLKGIQILHEDDHVLILNKPAGILSQKASDQDLSLNEWMIGYLLASGQISETALETFKPSICNRLDRNTSGLVLCGKSLAGSQELSRLIRERSVRKFYRTFVKGKMTDSAHITGYLTKNEKSNKVSVSKEPCTDAKSERIETSYEPLQVFPDRTYVEVELITGKSHQIRAHLASTGHPLLGDTKYGDSSINNAYRQKYGIRWQILHAYRMEFPMLTGALAALSGQTVIAPLPEIYIALLNK